MVEPVIIGNATLYCGDCLEILPEIGEVDAVVTDPPYNVGKDYGQDKDSRSESEYRILLSEVASVTYWQSWCVCKKHIGIMLSALGHAHPVSIQRGAQGPQRWGWFDQHELVFVRGSPRKVAKDVRTDIRLTGEGYFFREETYGHPGYTPTALMTWLCDLAPIGAVLDPFLGTGTTGVACMNLGRKFIGIEIEQKYFDIACERIDQAQRQQRLFA